MKRTIKDWLIVLVALLDDVAALVVVLLVLRVLGIKVPLAIAIVVALLLGSLIFIIHKRVIPVLHRKKVTGSEGMLGCQGSVTKALAPVGVIRIGSEYWKAKSVGEDIAVGEEVEVLSVDGLTLTVKLKDIPVCHSRA
ncbi:NfeD family protein [Chloroflexota bacterium]